MNQFLFVTTGKTAPTVLTPDADLLPFTHEELNRASLQGFKYGHLYEEKSDEFLMNRTFIYVSSLKL